MWYVLFGAASTATASSEEWDPDEVLLLVASLVVTILGLRYTWTAFRAASPFQPRGRRAFVVLATVAAALSLYFFVTWHWSASEIAHGKAYTWLVMFMGTAWLFLCLRLFPWMSLSLREDVAERGNNAATAALCGALLGSACLFSGAQVGEGPSFWNNVFTVALAGAVWFGAWLILEQLTHLSRSITEDRNLAAGVRLGAYLLGTALVLARASAGNWHSMKDTTRDLFHDAWPATLLLVLAVITENLMRPSPKNPQPSAWSCGWPVALAYLTAASVLVVRLGWWEGAPR
jgi:uncharacterized membrane protein YjfL (UPF0719 family)